MKELHFETGLASYRLNDACEIQFNPTDSAFMEALYRTFEELDGKQETWEKQVKCTADKRKLFDIMRDINREMRDTVDTLFQAPVCDACFGTMNVFAMADGLPVWVNLFLAIMDEIDTAFTREQKMTNEKIKKYTAKYHR